MIRESMAIHGQILSCMHVTQELIKGKDNEVQQWRKISRKRSLKNGQKWLNIERKKNSIRKCIGARLEDKHVLEIVKRPVWQEWTVYIGIKENILEEKTKLWKRLNVRIKALELSLQMFLLQLIMEINNKNNCLKAIHCIPI